MQAHLQSSPAARTSLVALSSSPMTLPPPSPHRLAALRLVPPLRPLEPPLLSPEASLAHDARNLLNALGLYCQLLAMPGVLQPRHHHYATELNLIAARSSAMVLRLLKKSSVLEGPAWSSCDTPARSLSETMRSLTPVLQRLAGSSARITVTIAASLPVVDFPPEALERITVNLVLNAAQALQIAGPRAAEVHVHLGMAGGKLQLTVEDNGPGLPPSVAAAFLRPKPLPSGATRGIGHHIVHELAAATGGQLSVRVRPNKGTLFRLKWPVPGSPRAGSDDAYAAPAKEGATA